MIINNLQENKLKILIDNVDLIRAGIEPENFINNSNTTLSYINNLLKSNTNFIKKVIYGQNIDDEYCLTSRVPY